MKRSVKMWFFKINGSFLSKTEFMLMQSSGLCGDKRSGSVSQPLTADSDT